jgi:hypothetical protein
MQTAVADNGEYLRKKLEAYAQDTDAHVSAIVRSACIASLKQKASHLFWSIEKIR